MRNKLKMSCEIAIPRKVHTASALTETSIWKSPISNISKRDIHVWKSIRHIRLSRKTKIGYLFFIPWVFSIRFQYEHKTSHKTFTILRVLIYFSDTLNIADEDRKNAHFLYRFTFDIFVLYIFVYRRKNKERRNIRLRSHGLENACERKNGNKRIRMGLK